METMENNLLKENELPQDRHKNIKKYSMNRELSWLNFNKRVLYESLDPLVPPFEAFKFVAIFKSNLEEFYRVRVGSLTDLSYLKEVQSDNKTGMSPKEQLEEIFKQTHVLLKEKDKVYAQVMKNLEDSKVVDVPFEDLDKVEKKEVVKYFRNFIEPILSPQIIDFHHPFPFLENNKLYIVYEMVHLNEKTYGLVQVPDSINRFYKLDREGIQYIRVENIIKELSIDLFKNLNIQQANIITVIRNADINLEDYLADHDEDYRTYMKKILKKRNRLQAVALCSNKNLGKELVRFLSQNLSINENQFFVSESPLVMNYVFELEELTNNKKMKKLLYKPFSPQHNPAVLENAPLIEQILKKDTLCIYPYEDIGQFIQLLEEAAEDPRVISIKITIYRLAKNSRIIRNLIKAAENGKNVTVLMELQARFDEENNINYSDILIESGCNIIYGISGYKVHSKICLITMNINESIRHITQIGTGNYNEKTARLYTDLSLTTSNEAIGMDAVNFFQNMNIGNINGDYNSLIVAPVSFKSTILELIDEEIKKGEQGRIFFKFNSFTDKDLIIKLSEASNAGVKIRLIIRGISCLRPGIPGYTENIEIRSVVGRFLEHPRIYKFGDGELSKIYIGSADLMTRNTERRVEVAAPIFDSDIKEKINDYLELQWKDNVKARIMDKQGMYKEIFVEENEEKIISQDEMIKKALDPPKEILEPQVTEILVVPVEESPKLTLWERIKNFLFG